MFGKMAGKESELTDVNDQSPEDKAIVAFVRGKLDERRQASSRTAQESINLTNIAYLCGFDSVYFDAQSRQFKPTPSPSKLIRANRVHVNRILPTVQNRLARLCKNPPRWDVRPKSADEEDKDAARLAEQVIIQLWEQLGINRKRISLTMWLQQCGSAYLKASWDPTLGEKKVSPKDVQKPDGTIERTYDIVAEGDLRVDVCSFFEAFPDPLAKSWDEVQDMLQAKVRPIAYFPQTFPERGGMVKEEDCWLNSLSYEARINSFNSVNGGAGAPNAQLKNSAIEISYYEKPSKKHPYGRHIIIANGVKLKDDVLPVDEIPFVKFDDIVVGGKLCGEAIITHLRPLQDQINKGKSMRQAWTNRMLTGKIIAARGHNILEEAFNDQSGEVVEYDPVPLTAEPHAFAMPTIPQYAFEEESTLKDDMNDTAGINEASRGQMPSSSIPAIGMQLLVEQDDTRIGVETEQHEHSFADLGRILLKFVAKNYITERLLKTVGEDMEYAVRKFKGTDIRENFDVHVIRGSTLPGSKVLKRQEILNLADRGYYGNPQDPTTIQNVMSMLEYGDEYMGWKRHSLRMAQIQRGIAMIEDTSEKPPVSEFDDHALWIQELDDYRISEKFGKLAPDQKQIVLELMNEHADWILKLTGQDRDPNADPELSETDAAQQAEDQAKLDVEAAGEVPSGQIEPISMPQPQITQPPGTEMPAPGA